MLLRDEERCQYEIYRYLAAEQLDGRVFYLAVLKAERLAGPVPVSSVARQTKGRCFCFMDDAWETWSVVLSWSASKSGLPLLFLTSRRRVSL